MIAENPFKSCACGTVWENRELFIRDGNIDPIGMSLLPRKGTKQLYFYFNHKKCESTLMMDAEDFSDLIKEPIPQQVMAGEAECPLHCAHIEDLEECEHECRNAPFRRLLLDQIMKKKA
jgi:hypothetical protein